ncbi:E3 ubiquitin-protein ligase lubel [Heterodontus francisci]|uniref:E3 ubiquitin-protein ligase lubel n=1 Tax=Heterodontus francisci TaxID=7792 RepID=UPI00355C5C6C
MKLSLLSAFAECQRSDSEAGGMMSVSGKPLNSALIECSYCYPSEVVKELRNVQAMYKNLSVCFDFYCHGTGVKSKLVHLNGTIPVACRGLIYNVPISIWLHNTHPQNPPRCFVKGLPIPCRNPGIHMDNTGMKSSSYLCNWKYPASHLVGLIEDIRTSCMNCLNNPTQSALSQAQFPPNSLAMLPQPSCTIVPSIGNGYQSLQNIPQQLNSGCLQPVYSNKWPLSCQHQGSDNSVSPARISPSSSLLPSRSLREAVKGKSDHAMKKKMDSVEQTADLFKDLELDKVLNAFNLVTSSRNKQGVADKFSSDQIELEDAKPLRLYDAQNSSLFKDKRRVHVLNIPVELPWHRMKDKLTIFFQRAINGGGEIVDFRYPTRIPGSAVITFDDAKVAERIAQQEHHVIIINNKNFTMQAKLYNEKDGALAEDDSAKILPEDMAHTCQNWLDLQSIPVDLPREKSEMFQRLLSLQDQNFNADDVMEVVHSGLNYESALRYLSHECPICREHVSFSKIVTMTHCSCSFCQDCFRNYFSSVIKEKSIISSVCPLCSTPDLKSHHLQEDVTEYFNLLDIQIRHYLDEETHELFQRKLRDRTLMEMPNFRWCAHCSFGLLHEIDRLRIDCPSCKKSTCFQCNIPWEQQHEGISCEKFKIWKQQNNPEYQASKLESYLTKNGIECPNCRVRFDLSRGGCIHFNCTECHHQFCGGCKRPFKLGSACTFMSNCQTMGLHAHHPRDCFYHLRDWSVERLQKLLHTEHISLTAFLSDNSLGQVEGKCKVMEQKETSHGLKDEQCGHPSVKGYLGFCKIHFKQFLVELINKNSLDPAILYSKEEMLTELQRWGVTSPNQHVDEQEEQFTQRLRIKIMNELKLDNQQKTVFDKSS